MGNVNILKIACMTWENASRDRRELSVYRDLDANVIVMAKGDINDIGRDDVVEGFRVLRYSTRPLGQHIPNSINRFISLFTWAHYARKLQPDVISGHDIQGLFIGWLSSFFMHRESKPKLIYDAHEFEIGRSAKRSKIHILFIKYLEKFLMNKCAFSIMVNDSIADEVQRIHNLEKRPIVVRNIPNRWNIDEKSIKRQRLKFIQALNLPSSTFLLIYHGAIMPNRGIENMLIALSQTKDTAAIILGNGSREYLSELHEQVKALGIEKRTLFQHAVPISDLVNYVGAADVGMVLIRSINANHRYSLPNKYFENIQSLTPVVVSNFPELGRLTKMYGIGIAVNPENIDEIKNAIEHMRDDNVYYANCIENLKTAKAELCWENERIVLENAYRSSFMENVD